MSISRFVTVSLLAAAFLPALSKAHEPQQPVQDNQVNLTVVKHDGHIQFNCVPANADTASRSNWKAICNRLAAKQASQLANSGMIAPVEGSVFDSSTSGDALSRHVPLSQKHL